MSGLKVWNCVLALGTGVGICLLMLIVFTIASLREMNYVLPLNWSIWMSLNFVNACCVYCRLVFLSAPLSFGCPDGCVYLWYFVADVLCPCSRLQDLLRRICFTGRPLSWGPQIVHMLEACFWSQFTSPLIIPSNHLRYGVRCDLLTLIVPVRHVCTSEHKLKSSMSFVNV